MSQINLQISSNVIIGKRCVCETQTYIRKMAALNKGGKQISQKIVECNNMQLNVCMHIFPRKDLSVLTGVCISLQVTIHQ